MSEFKGFIEVISLSRIEAFDKDMNVVTRFEKERELINLDNIALVNCNGDIYLQRGYPNGDHVCKTDHTYDEIVGKIIEARKEVKQ